VCIEREMIAAGRRGNNTSVSPLPLCTLPQWATIPARRDDVAGEEEITRHVHAEAARDLASPKRPFVQRLIVIAAQSYAGQQQLQAMMQQRFPPPQPIACAAGCAWCCHVAVAVTIAELAALMNAIARWPEAEQQALRERVAELAAQRRKATSAEQLASRTPCPLLDVASGACRAYEARPLRCRGHNSMSARKCESSFFSGANDVPVYLPQMATAAAVHAGVREAVAAHLGVAPEAMHLELAAALDVAFALPPEQWETASAWSAARFAAAAPGAEG
jgi:Fe-S-cluster containining protein